MLLSKQKQNQHIKPQKQITATAFQMSLELLSNLKQFKREFFIQR
jgi:hypothetical protein